MAIAPQRAGSEAGTGTRNMPHKRPTTTHTIPVRPRKLVVLPRPGDHHKGLLTSGGITIPCVLGRGGVTRFKREGDGATPLGRYRILEAILRPDRPIKSAGGLGARFTRKDEAWCDDPDDGRYNRPIRRTAISGEERLWRHDHLYDAVIVISYNMRPVVRRRGSAIFMHLARSDGTATAGCVALAPQHLRRLLPRLARETIIDIGNAPRPLKQRRGHRRSRSRP